MSRNLFANFYPESPVINLDGFGLFDDYESEFTDKVIEEKSKKEPSELFKDCPELLSILPKCELGLECDNCGFCH